MKLMHYAGALMGLMGSVALADTDLLQGVTGISTGTGGDQSSGNPWVSEAPTSDDIFSYTAGDWHVGIQNNWLAGQVSIRNSALSIQMGAAASNFTSPNWAAVKVDATQLGNESPVSLSFSWIQDSAWGANNSFSATFTVTVVGIDATGTSSTELGSWSTVLNGGTVPAGMGTQSVSIDLTDASSYDTFGVIVTSTKNEGAGAGGAGLSITDLTIKTTPEPTTATLSLLALAGLCARRRRK